MDEYKRFLKMTHEVFDELLSYIEIDIMKQTTVLREPIPAKMKLAATLYYLSTRGGSRAAATSKIERFVIIVNDF